MKKTPLTVADSKLSRNHHSNPNYALSKSHPKYANYFRQLDGPLMQLFLALLLQVRFNQQAIQPEGQQNICRTAPHSTTAMPPIHTSWIHMTGKFVNFDIKYFDQVCALKKPSENVWMHRWHFLRLTILRETHPPYFSQALKLKNFLSFPSILLANSYADRPFKWP